MYSSSDSAEPMKLGICVRPGPTRRGAGSGGDAFADHGGGELHGVLGDQLEFAAAGITGHVLVAVIFCLDVNHGCAMRALAFVLAAIIPLVVVALRYLGQRFGFGNGILCVLARFAGKAVRVPPWRFRKF